MKHSARKGVTQVVFCVILHPIRVFHYYIEKTRRSVSSAVFSFLLQHITFSSILARFPFKPGMTVENTVASWLLIFFYLKLVLILLFLIGFFLFRDGVFNVFRVNTFLIAYPLFTFFIVCFFLLV
jgi:hypothetical protein